MVIRAGSSSIPAHQRRGEAILFVNGSNVGTVAARGGDTSWGFGTFFPGESFAEYAPLFGSWSVLMHAEDDAAALSKDAAMELARVEEALDSMKVHLFFIDDQQHVPVAQVIIEGDQLEWKEY